MLFEVEDVADVGAAPRVDRLVIVADDADVSMRRREQPQELELRAVGVLVLVDEDVAKALLPLCEYVGATVPEARHLADEIVEVERAKLAEGRLVARVDDLGHLVVLVDARVGQIARLCERVLGVRDAREDRRRIIRFVGLDTAQHFFHDAELIALVVDREGAAERGPLAREHAEAERVERRDGDAFLFRALISAPRPARD